MNENKKFENYVLIALIVLGLFIGAFLYFLPEGRPISSVFVTFGLSGLLYRFLGGIKQGTKFSVGVFRLGGPAAFMIGCIFFLNEYIYNSSEEDFVVLRIPKGKWVPIKYEHEGIKVLSSNGDTIVYNVEGTEIAVLRKSEYWIKKEGNDYYIYSNEDSTVIGHFNLEEVLKTFKSGVEYVVKDLRVFKLNPNPMTGIKNKEEKYKDTVEQSVYKTLPIIVEEDKRYTGSRVEEDSLLTLDIQRDEKLYIVSVDQNYFIVCILQVEDGNEVAEDENEVVGNERNFKIFRGRVAVNQ